MKELLIEVGGIEQRSVWTGRGGSFIAMTIPLRDSYLIVLDG